MAGSFFSVALQEEAAVALCGFLSVPLTCRGSSNSREVSWWFRWRWWNTPSERDEANRLVPNPTMAAAVLARYTTVQFHWIKVDRRRASHRESWALEESLLQPNA